MIADKQFFPSSSSSRLVFNVDASPFLPLSPCIFRAVGMTLLDAIFFFSSICLVPGIRTERIRSPSSFSPLFSPFFSEATVRSSRLDGHPFPRF